MMNVCLISRPSLMRILYGSVIKKDKDRELHEERYSMHIIEKMYMYMCLQNVYGCDGRTVCIFCIVYLVSSRLARCVWSSFPADKISYLKFSLVCINICVEKAAAHRKLYGLGTDGAGGAGGSLFPLQLRPKCHFITLFYTLSERVLGNALGIVTEYWRAQLFPRDLLLNVHTHLFKKKNIYI